MTPQSPKPSMHDVVTKFYQPNDADKNNGIRGTFGTTTNILNGGVECNKGHNLKAEQRGEYYKEFLEYFGITDPDQGYECKTEGKFSAKSAGAIHAYYEWDWHWGSEKRCMLVKWQTAYSAYVKDDYKRCVCDEVGENGVFGADVCQDA